MRLTTPKIVLIEFKINKRIMGIINYLDIKYILFQNVLMDAIEIYLFDYLPIKTPFVKLHIK